MVSIGKFQRTVWEYYNNNRRDMPWRRTDNPYRILVSEVMLQQTQVSRVVPFYERFIKKFPNFHSLSQAKKADVLGVWQGLGYNRRALALKDLARKVIEDYGGRLPKDAMSLASLPGIGKYTAGAIRTFAFREPDVFIETNIRRVFIHFFFPRRKEVTDNELKRYIERSLDHKDPREWYFALMDYGAMLGAATKGKNPNRRSAHYSSQSRFTGSDRELRGKILRELLSRKKILISSLHETLDESPERVLKVLSGLGKEGFLFRRRDSIYLAN